MSYQALDALPEFEHLATGDRGLPLPSVTGLPRWGAPLPPPAIGTEIVLIVNGQFPAVVTGYFIEENYLGLRCRMHKRPASLSRGRAWNPDAHAFGPEFRLA